jgi:hypothetical protein
MPESVNSEIERVLQSGVGELSVRELLGLMLSGLGLAECKAYLARSSADKANGFYQRSLSVGSMRDERVQLRLLFRGRRGLDTSGGSIERQRHLHARLVVDRRLRRLALRQVGRLDGAERDGATGRASTALTLAG